jgi:hypothetical protein
VRIEENKGTEENKRKTTKIQASPGEATTRILPFFRAFGRTHYHVRSKGDEVRELCVYRSQLLGGVVYARPVAEIVELSPPEQRNKHGCNENN